MFTRFSKLSFMVFFIVLLLSPPLYGEQGSLTELPLGTAGDRCYHLDGSFSANPVIITDSLSFQDISSHLYYFFAADQDPDPRHILTSGFSPTNGRVCWGSKKNACWFKFDYVARISKPKRINIEVLVTGFPLTVEPGQKGTILIYLNYPAGIISTTRIFSAQAYHSRMTFRTAFTALLLGILLSLILYNLVIFLWTRDLSFFYFFLYLLVFAFHIYLREDYFHNLFPFLRDYYFSIPPLVFATLFAMTIFNTRKNFPVQHRILGAFVAVGIVLSLLSPFFRASSVLLQNILNIYRSVMLAYELGLIIYFSFRRIWEALFFLVSWVPLIVTVIFLQLEQAGVLQTNGPFLFFMMRDGMYVAVAYQAVLISVVLARKINLFRRKAEVVQNEKSELERIDRLRTRYFMNISHEFRTPLTLIIGLLDNIGARKLGDRIPWNQKVFSILKRNAERLVLLVDNMLKIMQLDLHKYRVKNEEVSLTSYLEFMVSEFESLAERDSKILLFCNRAGGEIIINTDKALLDTIVLNLLSNAFKYTPSGGRIVISLDVKDQRVCLVEVCDTGPGIPPDKIDDIFKRFYRVRFGEEQKIGGAGLGLAIVRRALELISGRVQAGNRDGGGAFFHVYLPYVRRETKVKKITYQPTREIRSYEDSLNRDEDKEITQKPEGNKPPVLVVEDNDDLRAYLEEGLRENFNVFPAPNGKKALELLQTGLGPRLILCDIMMPEMDGIEFYKVISADGYRDIPFIFLTARVSEEEKITALSGGAVDYIYKPFSLQSLLAKIGSMVLQQRMVKEKYKQEVKERFLQYLEEPENPKEPVGKRNTDKQRLELFLTHYRFSPREKEVLALFYQGLRDKEIAAKLDLAPSTVSNLLSRVYKKTSASGRTHLLRMINRSAE